MTQQMGHSETKSMLTELGGSYRHSEISAKWAAKIWLAYDKIYCIKTQNGYINYLRSVVLIFDIPRDGAIIFWRDNEQEDLFWIDGYSNGQLPRPEKVRMMLLICGAAGAKTVSANVQRSPRMGRFFEIVGMQNLDEFTYSINVELFVNGKVGK